MYELQEVRVSIPYTSYKGKTYDYFDRYYNDIFKNEYDLINVQLLKEDGLETEYVFWHRHRG